MLFCLILFQRSLKLSLLLLILFSFSYLVCVFSIALSNSSLIHASISSMLLLNPYSIFFCLITISVWYLLIFSIFLLKFSLCSSILLLRLDSYDHLYDHYFDLFIKYIAYLHLIKLFLGICFLWFGTYCSVSSLCLSLCVRLYVLGEMATSLTLEGVILWRSSSV